jgi:hypothetical protein
MICYLYNSWIYNIEQERMLKSIECHKKKKPTKVLRGSITLFLWKKKDNKCLFAFDLYRINYHIWSKISGKHVDTPVTGTLQSALTQQQSGRVTRACTRNIDRDDQFDSDLWEPYDPMHGVEGIIIALAWVSILIC